MLNHTVLKAICSLVIGLPGATFAQQVTFNFSGYVEPGVINAGDFATGSLTINDVSALTATSGDGATFVNASTNTSGVSSGSATIAGASYINIPIPQSGFNQTTFTVDRNYQGTTNSVQVGTSSSSLFGFQSIELIATDVPGPSSVIFNTAPGDVSLAQTFNFLSAPIHEALLFNGEDFIQTVDLTALTETITAVPEPPAASLAVVALAMLGWRACTAARSGVAPPGRTPGR